jgi:anhydro-N-acetylmuramic acid kinase
VWHDPPRAGRGGASLQIGCAATIAERTGIDVVHDFRARDVAAGGHGAPLVPWVDGLLFGAQDGTRVLVNIGGMANLTRVPRRASGESLLAFDTGPGNVLIDAAASIASDGAETCDTDGRLARAGNVDDALLHELLAHPFFEAPPPKSTGREMFGRSIVERVARERELSAESDRGWPDLVATLTALTARTIADAVSRWVLPLGADELIVTGGGARNPALLRMIEEAVAPLSMRPADTLGVDPDAKEAVAFATLAWAHLRGVAGNVPEVTGASGPRLLGSFTPA